MHAERSLLRCLQSASTLTKDQSRAGPSLIAAAAALNVTTDNECHEFDLCLICEVEFARFVATDDVEKRRRL